MIDLLQEKATKNQIEEWKKYLEELEYKILTKINEIPSLIAHKVFKLELKRFKMISIVTFISNRKIKK